MAKGRKRGKYPYKFTAKRKTALKKAQTVSARKRRKSGVAAATGGIVVAGAVGYVGYRRVKTGSWKMAVQPWNKEAVRKVSAISPASTPRGQIRVEKLNNGMSPPRISKEELARAANPDGVREKETPRVNRGGRTSSGHVREGNVTPQMVEEVSKRQEDQEKLDEDVRNRIPHALRPTQDGLVGPMVMQRAVSQHKNAIGHLQAGGGKDAVPRQDLLDMQFATGEARGRRTPKRKKTKAPPGMSQKVWDIINRWT